MRWKKSDLTLQKNILKKIRYMLLKRKTIVYLPTLLAVGISLLANSKLEDIKILLQWVKEPTNHQREREETSTVSEKEWLLLMVEKY